MEAGNPGAEGLEFHFQVPGDRGSVQEVEVPTPTTGELIIGLVMPMAHVVLLNIKHVEGPVATGALQGERGLLYRHGNGFAAVGRAVVRVKRRILKTNAICRQREGQLL